MKIKFIIFVMNVIKMRKEYHKEYYQKNKEKIKEYAKEYEQRPEVKKRRKEDRKEYDQTPQSIKYHKEYRQRPEVKQRYREYHQRPKIKEKRMKLIKKGILIRAQKKKIQQLQNKIKKQKKIEVNNETDELNYSLAGFFEARGIIYMNHNLKKRKENGLYVKRDNYTIRFQLFCEKEVAKLFKQNFGGTIYRGKWLNWGPATIDFLQAIKPYIVGSKFKKRVVVAMEFCEFQLKHHQERSPEIRKKRKGFYLKMRKLN